MHKITEGTNFRAASVPRQKLNEEIQGNLRERQIES